MCLDLHIYTWFPLGKWGLMRCAVLPYVLYINVLVLLIAGVPHLVPQTGGQKAIYQAQIPVLITLFLKPPLNP